VSTTEIRHEVVVDLTAADAFRTFMDLDRIKPREHNMLGVPIAETVVEERVGGAIYDRGTDGTTCRWARVLAYEPPHLLRFSWDIGPTWQVETDPERTSEVEVTFAPDAADAARTRVTLVHRHLDRHGSGWESLRDGVDNPGGWPLYLERFEQLATAGRP
jgi:uncharacterized protein YndB with AHSA1/START domain